MRSDTLGRVKATFTPHPPRPPKAQQSRSGRNMPAAIATALILLGVVALSLIFEPMVFAVLVMVAQVVALWEITGAFLAKDIHLPLAVLVVATLMMGLATLFAGIAGGFIAFLFGVLAVLMWRIFSQAQRPMIEASAGVFALAWIGLAGIFAIAFTLYPQAVWLVATLILMPSASDTGGLAAGIFFGKHPIAPKISPKKSWEGFVGSVLLSGVGAFLLIHLALGLGWLWVAIFTVVTPILATAGDFAESLVKRALGIKDMGSIFPGHGGVLDRIDSILFCAPTFYLLFTIALGLSL